jgi:hypothetical protein
MAKTRFLAFALRRKAKLTFFGVSHLPFHKMQFDLIQVIISIEQAYSYFILANEKFWIRSFWIECFGLKGFLEKGLL